MASYKTILWQFYITTRVCNSIAAMLCNMLTLVSFVKFKYLRSSANILVANIALSDFLHGLVFIFLIVRSFVVTPLETRMLCMTGLIIEIATLYTELGSFMFLAIERWNSLLALLNKRKKWGNQRILIIVGCMWVMATTWTISVCVLYADSSVVKPCIGSQYFPPFFVNVTVGFFILTTLTVFIFYGGIAWQARKSHTQVAADAPSTSQMQTRKRDMQITRMMAMVCGVFFALYCPMLLMSFVMSPRSSDWHRGIFYVTVLFYDVNFWINSVIYAWRDKNFRKAFNTILKRIRALFPECPCSGPPAGHVAGGNNVANTPGNGEQNHEPQPGPSQQIHIPRRDVEIPQEYISAAPMRNPPQ